MESSTVISISHENEVPRKEKNQSRLSLLPCVSFVAMFWENASKNDIRNMIHSIKVGVALALVSLMYLADPLYQHVGDNAMWAIMTVVVIFEFYAGATLGKGLNRGMGTTLGALLGCLTAALAQTLEGVGSSIVVGSSVFIFGAAASYVRLVPRIKKRYDYGVMIFILTFNLVVMSGIRVEKILELARDRLLTIVTGFAICISVSLFVLPQWASDELHDSTASRFKDLACTVESCMKAYAKQNQEPGTNFSACKAAWNSKSKDESLVNFAKWEPWHGRFGFFHPWDKYLKIGDVLRELAVIIYSSQFCFLHNDDDQSRTCVRESTKEPCEAVGSLLAWTLEELGESLEQMTKFHAETHIAPKLKSARVELNLLLSSSKTSFLDDSYYGLSITSLAFLFMELLNKVEELAKEVEELGDLAGFHETNRYSSQG